MNLVDLVEIKHTGQPVVIFDNVEDLREYTIDSAKYFPKQSAYAGGILKFLLREILNHRQM